MIEVKNIYVDQKIAPKEQKRGKDVWILESESFKEPVSLQIEYSDKDKERIESKKQEIESQKKSIERMIQTAEDNLKEQIEVSKKYKEECQLKDKKIEKLEKQLIKSEKEKKEILKEVEWIRAIMFSHNEQLDAMKDILNEIKQKVTKEPRVFSGQTFVSWNWLSALTALKVPDGNYIVNRATKIVEKNEYVENEDIEVGWFNVHVQDGIFTPEYDLRGTTELDTPTATINRTFTMIPY